MRSLVGLLFVFLPFVAVAATHDPDAEMAYIEFPDGEVLPVNILDRDAGGEPIVDVGRSYNKYKKMVDEGDSHAAAALWIALEDCERFGYQSHEKLEAAIARTRASGRYSFAFGDKEVSVGSSPDQVSAVKQAMRAISKRCRGISKNAVAKAEQFKQIAYERNSPIAILRVAQSTTDDAERMDAYEKAWSVMGDHTAPSWIALGYQEGWGVEPDLVKSHAYMLLGHELARIAFTKKDGSAHSYFYRVSPQSKLDESANQLTHTQYVEAVELAKDILTQNTVCCEF